MRSAEPSLAETGGRRLPDVDKAREAYEQTKRRAAERSAAISLASRDLGDLPPVGNPERREQAARSLRAFCEQYQAATFSLAWSPDHLKVIGKLERAIMHGGLFAVAMPRGSGKTALCEAAALWALLYGHRRFVVFIGADATAAEESLESIRIELETSELLYEDFPEVCYPIHRLGRSNQKRLLYRGRDVRMRVANDEIVLPDIPGSPSSSAIIRVAGITGRIRGMKAKRSDGQTVRPDLVIPDDPQTDESALSVSQCAARERIISGAILGLAGPGRKIAGVMPCTVIRTGDVADNCLDPRKRPEWNGERCRMLYDFPEDLTWWLEIYKPTLDASHAAGRGITDATELYRANRERADRGARVGWPERFEPDEASAIQSAMNIFLRDEEAFWAEYQNQPKETASKLDEDLIADQIAARVTGYDRGALAAGVQHLTAFVDVQDHALFWVVAGWAENFTGWIVDYGTYPDQRRQYFAYADVRQTLANATGVDGVEAQIYAGLVALESQLLQREFRREDGAVLTIERLIVDANWRSDTIYSFCRASRWPTVVTPSHGRYVGAGTRTFGEYKPKPGDRIGDNWRMPNVAGRRSVRYLLFDANHWKSFIASRLSVGMGGNGALGLFGTNPAQHRLLSEHFTAEWRDRKTSDKTGRTVDEWKSKIGRPDNHWWDCIVGCAVGASMQGCALPGQVTAKEDKRRKVALPSGARRRA